MKNIFHVARKLVALLLLGITVTGCAYTRYGVEISNVQYVREMYIRNTGTTDWGPNIVRNMKNINKSNFSERVDIRVIDSNGIAYSKYGVPFNDTAFVKTGKTYAINPYAAATAGAAGLVALAVLLLWGPALFAAK